MQRIFWGVIVYLSIFTNTLHKKTSLKQKIKKHTSVASGAFVQTRCVPPPSCTSLFCATDVRECLLVCVCVCVSLRLRFCVVVLNSGPQAPALYRFLFQPGPTKTNN